MEKKELRNLIVFTWTFFIGFIFLYLWKGNYEFLVDVFSLMILFYIIIKTLDKTKFTKGILYLISFLILVHLLTGGVIIGGKSLYHLELFHIIGEGDSFILRLDQLMHFFGIFVVTVVAHHFLKKFTEWKKSNFIYLTAFFIGIGWVL